MQTIFLNAAQMEIISNNGLDESCLLDDNIEEHFCNSDIWIIREQSEYYKQPGKLLNMLGFNLQVDEELVISNHRGEYEEFENLPQIKAVCPSENLLVITPVEGVSTPNHMLDYNLQQIVSAMGKVLPFQTVAKTKQFELLV